MESKIICNFKKNYIMLSQNIITSKQEFVLGEVPVQRLISKNFMSDLIKNKYYEITSRNTRDFL